MLNHFATRRTVLKDMPTAENVGDNGGMFQIILFRPEIPPNTGNIIRLCANTGAALHLIEPLGFELDDAKLRRAGLDYHEFADVRCHSSLDACLMALNRPRLFAFSRHAQRHVSEVAFASGDAFLFGQETKGLPDAVMSGLQAEQKIRLPMRPGQRSLNLSNAAAVVVYEAWRQHGFAGCE